MIRVFEAFAGYGTSSFALKQLGVEFELVGFSEIDKYAIKCFEQNHSGKNFEDITKIDWSCVPNFDLLTGGFPCQAFSTAGKQLGEQDSRGVLGLELTRALIAKQPKYFLFENVKGFMSKRFKDTREKFVKSWEDAGYIVYHKVLNTKDFGIPQNRERVWFVGIRKDIEKDFKFPEPFELKLKLKDVLEDNVGEKYFLKQEQIDKLFKHLKDQKDKGNSFGVDALPMDIEKSSRTLFARDYKQPKCVSIYRHSFEGFKGYEDVSVSLKSSEGSGNQVLVIDKDKCVCNDGKVCDVCCEFCGNYKDECGCKDAKVIDVYNKKIKHDGVCITLSEPHHNNLRVMTTLTQATGNRAGSSKEYIEHVNRVAQTIGQVRRLTPKECFRLQGFLNDEVNLEGLSDTQKYKLAGNGQSVNVVKLLLKELVKNE